MSKLRVLIMSDTHGRKDRIDAVIKQVGPYDVLIHAGDHAEDVLDQYPHVHTVCGNCDPAGVAEVEHLFELLGVRCLVAHGHTLNVKTSPLTLIYRAAEHDAKLVVYGHTHTPVLMVEDGRVLMNPGSLSYARGYTECTYAVVDLVRGDDGVVSAEFAYYLLDGTAIPAFTLKHTFL